jgi:hypothetical protein
MAELPFADPALRRAYRALMLDRPDTGHLDEATWDRLAGNEIEQAARDEAFDHIVSCDRCSTIWKGVLALAAEAETERLIPREGQARPFWRTPIVTLAIAATLVIAIGGLFLMRSPAPAPDTVRSNGTLAPIEGLMMAYDPNSVPAFVWPPVPAATNYRVEVFSEDGRPIWSADVAAPPTRWPGDVARAKGAYRWRVEAMTGDQSIARSRLTPMELTR